MSDTTAMMDVTATMLPSTVISDPGFDVQMASGAMPADSRSLYAGESYLAAVPVFG